MKSTFKKIVIPALLVFVAIAASAQKAKKAAPILPIPMEPAYWQYDTAGVAFIMKGNIKAAYIKNGSPLKLKNGSFANGTIEFDFALGKGFPGITFRQSADGKTSDHFYIRYFGSTSPESRTTLQYSANVDGMSIWDLTDEYQAGANLTIPDWNHVKLVISGKQMKAYVNNMDHAALVVPALEGGLNEGGISFSGGEVSIANVLIKPDVVEDLSPLPGYISTYNDPRYLRNWQVTTPVNFPYGKDVQFPMLGGNGSTEFPDSSTQWLPIMAEPRGIVNLTRLYGSVKNRERRLAWLKTTITSETVQERIVNLGFSDEVWLFVNGQFIHADKNLYDTPGQKFPRGRCSIENATIKIPLKKGNNVIMIALTNYFYGWGIIARIDDTEGIHLPVAP